VVGADEAAAAAARIGYPIVIKAVSDTLAHKTEAGGVQLNLRTAEQVEAAVASMAALSDRFLVESMANGAVAELIVGVGRDPQFGLSLTLGAGGILVELLKDSRILLLPVSRDEVSAALRALRIWPLLEGFRGRPAADVGALVDAVIAVADYAIAHAQHLQELDVNPLLALPVGCGALAVDALIRISEGDAP
jgi:acetyl-CoA synthetase